MWLKISNEQVDFCGILFACLKQCLDGCFLFGDKITKLIYNSRTAQPTKNRLDRSIGGSR